VSRDAYPLKLSIRAREAASVVASPGENRELEVRGHDFFRSAGPRSEEEGRTRVTRRKLLQQIGQITITSRLSAVPLRFMPAIVQPSGEVAGVSPPEHLTGTQPLAQEGDLAAQMVEGIRQFLV
jgi:hypothetical protein